MAQLRADWRTERNIADLAAGVPALGSKSWAIAMGFKQPLPEQLDQDLAS